ncbi:hypothetical protein CEXT_212131 [Caerostris extrusa]|uniref:Uncharacterized protein n=1 Tax=Caerostris extrusa TaxID=172846 RepID=A0AAV4NEJ8_CAEEX|nr:hypothetical protein CEXT_212131 [Caerostris extrusa]
MIQNCIFPSGNPSSPIFNILFYARGNQPPYLHQNGNGERRGEEEGAFNQVPLATENFIRDDNDDVEEDDVLSILKEGLSLLLMKLNLLVPLLVPLVLKEQSPRMGVYGIHNFPDSFLNLK